MTEHRIFSGDRSAITYQLTTAQKCDVVTKVLICYDDEASWKLQTAVSLVARNKIQAFNIVDKFICDGWPRNPDSPGGYSVNYLERYHKGEYEQVWNDLQALGQTVRDEPHYSQAQAVAAETMRRVRRNCERLITNLRTLGYVFGTYPDGSRRRPTIEPLTPSSDILSTDCAELEAEAGPLPLSLTAFWQEVGAVDLVGMHPAWPDGLDPLVVDPPEGALAFLYDLEEDEAEVENARWFAGLAPDDLHKDNVSGGDPYGVYLPNPSADFVFLYERHGLHFVPYLRLAILQWGGLPGLAEGDKQFEPLDNLVAGLELF